MKYANQQQSKMGAFRPPKEDRETRRKMELNEKFKKSSVPRWVVCEFLPSPLSVMGDLSPKLMPCVDILLFVLLGGVLFELVKLFF